MPNYLSGNQLDDSVERAGGAPRVPHRHTRRQKRTRRELALFRVLDDRYGVLATQVRLRRVVDLRAGERVDLIGQVFDIRHVPAAILLVVAHDRVQQVPVVMLVRSKSRTSDSRTSM